MSTDKRNAPSDIPIEHAENGTVSATNGAQSGAINDKCMSEGKLTIVVVTLAILTFLGILSETSLNIAYSALMEEFAISADVVQWLTTGYLLLLSVAIPTSPFMVRKFPTKALFVMAIALFSVGTLVGALALNFPMLLAARLIMALGTGVSLPLLTNIILDKAPFHKRGMMLGLVSLVTCAAPAIGPVFGGLVMEFLNWHWIFYAMIPFLVISFVLGAATVPDIRHGEKGYLSVPSLLLVAVGLAGIIVAASFFAQWNGDWRFWSVLIGAIVVLAVFAVLQLRMAHPLVEVRTFAYSGFTLGMVILLMSSGGVLGVNFLLPILLQRGLGHTSMVASSTPAMRAKSSQASRPTEVVMQVWWEAPERSQHSAEVLRSGCGFHRPRAHGSCLRSPSGSTTSTKFMVRRKRSRTSDMDTTTASFFGATVKTRRTGSALPPMPSGWISSFGLAMVPTDGETSSMWEPMIISLPGVKL